MVFGYVDFSWVLMVLIILNFLVEFKLLCDSFFLVFFKIGLFKRSDLLYFYYNLWKLVYFFIKLGFDYDWSVYYRLIIYILMI